MQSWHFKLSVGGRRQALHIILIAPSPQWDMMMGLLQLARVDRKMDAAAYLATLVKTC